ncbi:MAG: hypothetical protein KIT80_13220 [Chitinophagaceae bacterium]|nr:hypothetical protein [Chitinophagaceae bacterium]MCW5927868.1 hypothetical protein [Chitinophagaceae bacterium]
MQGVISSDIGVTFKIISSEEEKYYTEGFAFGEGHQKVDTDDFEEHSKWRDPLNTIIHETAERYNAEKTGNKEYGPNHAEANSVEFRITGKREANSRHIGNASEESGIFIKRFDYVDRSGNYLNTREIRIHYGRTSQRVVSRLVGGRALNKNTKEEQAQEKRFKSDK